MQKIKTGRDTSRLDMTLFKIKQFLKLRVQNIHILNVTNNFVILVIQFNYVKSTNCIEYVLNCFDQK